MTKAFTCFSVVVASLAMAAPVFAQHEGHIGTTVPTAGASPQLVAQCVDSQRQTLDLMNMANTSLESARQSNSPSELRAATTDLQRLLLEARAALGRCTDLQQSIAQSASTPAQGHDMSNMADSATSPAAASAPPPTAVAPARHVMVQTAFAPGKLACAPRIDAKVAPTATYQGKIYYFCSAKDRDEFLTDPAMSLSMMPPKQ